MVLDGAILEAPLLGEGVDQKAGWSELLREAADAAAGELLAATGKKCRVEKFEEIAGESQVSRAFQLRSGERAWTILVRDEVRAAATEAAAERPAAQAVAASSRCSSVLHAGSAARSPDCPGLELLLDVELEASLRFGCREMPLGEILDLGPGDVVRAGPPCGRPRGPDCGRQDCGPRRSGAGERQLRPAGDRGGRAQEAAGEHPMPLLSRRPRHERRQALRRGLAGSASRCADRASGASTGAAVASRSTARDLLRPAPIPHCALGLAAALAQPRSAGL